MIIHEMIREKYPLKCDGCYCPECSCDGYSKEQIELFKDLARREVPISLWPISLFDKPIPF